MLALQLAEAFLSAVSLLLVCRFFYNERLKTVNAVLYIVLSAVTLTAVLHISGVSQNTECVLAMLICTLFCAVTRISGLHRILYSAVGASMLMYSGCFLCKAAGIKPELLLSSSFCIVASAVMAFVSARLQGKKEKLSAVTKIVLPAFVLAFSAAAFSDKIPSSLQCVFISVTFLLAACFVKSFIDLEESNRQKEYRLEQYQDNLSQMYDMMRVFRHNFRNLVIGVKGCLKEQNYEEMNELLGGVEAELADANIKQQMAVVSQLEDASVKWLLIAKLSAAQKYGINTSLVISKQIGFGRLKKNEFNAILGNLLDNAIEAAKESENKLLKIAIFNKNGDTIVSVKNSFANKPVLGKVFDKGYSEKQGHSGLGLYGVKKIVDAYSDVLLDVKILNGYFTVDLNITGASA